MMLLRTLVVLLTGLLVPSTIVAQVTFNQIALTGEAVPGVDGSEFFDFSGGPSINASGDVAFQSQLNPPGVFGPIQAIFGPTSEAPLGVIAITGTQPPGVPDGALYSTFFAPSLNASGETVFRSNMSVGLGQVTSITQEAIFGSTSGAGSPLELIARLGDSAGLTDGAAFNFFSQVSLNDSGDVAFGSFLRTGTGAPVSLFNDATIFGPTSGVGSPLGLIVREGDPVPGVAGMEFDFLFTPALNASGDVAFRGGLRTAPGVVDDSSNNGIFGPISGAGSPLGLIAREGAPAPGVTDGAVFGSFVSPMLNASGDVAFPATLRGASVGADNGNAIFGPTSGAGSSLGLIARADTPAPGLADGAEFNSFGFVSLNAAGTTAFAATLRTGTGAPVGLNNNRGLFINSAGEQECILRSGDQITVTLPDGSGTEERTVGFVELSPTGLSDQGVVAFQVTFTDLTQGIFTADTGSVLLGDVNLDGIVNFLDISPFIMRLTTGVVQAEADINQDGIISFLDIAPFIQVLTSQS